MGMAHRRDSEGRGEIEVLVPIGIPHPGPMSPFPDDGKARADRGNARVLDASEPGEKGARAGAGAARSGAVGTWASGAGTGRAGMAIGITVPHVMPS